MFIWACCYQPLLQPRLTWNICFICLTFSVFNIKIFQFIKKMYIQERVHLYCQVLWFGVFYTLDMIWLSYCCYLYKKKSLNFTTLFFFVRTRTRQPLLFYKCFFFFFNVEAFLILDIAKSALSLSVQGLFSIICKWSKNACPTFLKKKICILRVWM